MSEPGLGKVDGEFLRETVYPHLGADRADVRVGPRAGVDFGVVDVDGAALVCATDPLSLPPGLGFAQAGRFALDICVADVAVSGVAPTHLAVGFSLPPEMTDAEFATAWTAMDERARELGISVATGHTARYPGVSFPWVGAATVFGVGAHEDVVRPDAARPGDALIVTTGPAAETAGLFASLFPDQLGLDAATTAAARERLAEVACVEDALVAADAGARAIHDATECGVQGGLVEMAASAGVRIEIERAQLPYGEGVQAVCETLGVDPLQVTSAGTLLVAAPDDAAMALVERLRDQGTRAAVVGCVADGNGLYIDGERREHPGADPSWAAYEAFGEG
ncbi:AIR synthase family protein [Halosegnis sp.]|uniref:AIR synthase family protein n=1 Tax=Halosegnis sp. TaxID=2864959 RepID=UPI0035D5038F